MSPEKVRKLTVLNPFFSYYSTSDTFTLLLPFVLFILSYSLLAVAPANYSGVRLLSCLELGYDDFWHTETGVLHMCTTILPVLS